MMSIDNVNYNIRLLLNICYAYEYTIPDFLQCRLLILGYNQSEYI